MNQNKKGHGGKLAETIRGIRVRLGMNMTQFARSVGVTHGQVSRYEAGLAVPSYAPLGRLLEMAEGTEKNPILDQLTGCLRGPGMRMTEAEAFSEIAASKSRFDALWANTVVTQPTVGPAPFWAKPLGIAPNLAALLDLVSQLYNRKREVDASLVKIVRLWLCFPDSDPTVRQCFADAAQYLNLMLLAKAGKAQANLAREKYRVIRAVDVGDGVVHQAGEIIDLDSNTWIRYAYALAPVGEYCEAEASNKKLA